MSEAELRKHHRVLHKRLQRGRPLDQSRRRAALVKETSDEAERRGWCTGAGTCAVSPMAAAHAQQSLRRRAAGVTVDRARGAVGCVIHLVNRPCE